jgi:hypothetical protein
VGGKSQRQGYLCDTALNLNAEHRGDCARTDAKKPRAKRGVLAGAEGGGRRVNEEIKILLCPLLVFLYR